jgi:tetratricopeptide (TPR) repeat protein
VGGAPLPEAKTPPPPPETFDNIEELYLTGLHLEQYRHPTIEPEPYWEAALAKDPTDVRCNNAMGLVHFRRGNFEKATAHFRTAIDKLTRRNPNPRDGAVFFNLGQALKFASDLDGAYAAFYKAIWSYAWQAAGYYALAEIDSLRGDVATALEHVNRSLVTNAMNMKARNLKATLLRHLGRLDEAAALCCETVGLDPLDLWSRNEVILQSRAKGSTAAQGQLAELVDLMHIPDPLSEIQAYLDMAFDYANAGFWDEATDVLSRIVGPDATAFPTVLYALGYFAHRQGREADARALYRRASAQSTDYCFPVRLEEMIILQHAQSLFPEDPIIAYYLGNLYYDKHRPEEAIAQWEIAVKGAPGLEAPATFAIPWRNLGIAAYNVRHDPQKAIACYETAFAANPQDGRVLGELDQLLQRTGVPAKVRLERLEQHLDLVRDRDDLSVEITVLYNQTGQPQKALDYALSRRFHPWEGGTGRISAQYVTAHWLLGRAALDAGDAQTALTHFEAALDTYPENLGERRQWHQADAHVRYYAGLAKQALGDADGARGDFEAVLAAHGWSAELPYYQALALKALGRADEAETKLTETLDRATRQLEEQAKQGFATSVPQFVFAEEDMETRRRTHLTYVIGLAHLGLGQAAEAKTAFETVLERDPNHFGVQLALRELK